MVKTKKIIIFLLCILAAVIITTIIIHEPKEDFYEVIGPQRPDESKLKDHNIYSYSIDVSTKRGDDAFFMLGIMNNLNETEEFTIKTVIVSHDRMPAGLELVSVYSLANTTNIDPEESYFFWVVATTQKSTPKDSYVFDAYVCVKNESAKHEVCGEGFDFYGKSPVQLSLNVH